MPPSEEGEATNLLQKSLNWYDIHKKQTTFAKPIPSDFKPVKITNFSEDNSPPCVRKILKGVGDGRKRAVFILINFFRSIGLEKDEVEKRVYEWNTKNKPPMKEGYIKSQISWTYRKAPVMPSNCKEFYQGIGVCSPDNICQKIKNPVSYQIKKYLFGKKRSKAPPKKKK